MELIPSASGCKCKTLFHGNEETDVSRNLFTQLLTLGMHAVLHVDEMYPLRKIVLSERDLGAVIELMDNAADLRCKAIKVIACAKASKQSLEKEDMDPVMPAGEPILNTAIRMGIDIDLIKELMIHGAGACNADCLGFTPLHWSANYLGNRETLVKELLRHKADANSTSHCGLTPLSLALERDSGVKVVQQLLKCGADIHIPNERGETPLTTAARNCNDLDVIQELFKHRPDCSSPENCNELLAKSIENMQFANILIKHTLIKFKGDHDTVFDLKPYKVSANYATLSRRVEDCISEIVRMKTTEVKNGLSLFTFVTSNDTSIALYPDNEGTKSVSVEENIIANFPIYGDMILPKAQHALERAALLTKLKYVLIYSNGCCLTKSVKEKKVLSYDSTHTIYKYLSNDDLQIFIHGIL